METKELLKPIKINDVEIKNRIAVAPMNMTYSTQAGYVTQQDIAHLTRRAQGGFGLIITGAIICTRLAAPFVFHRNLYLYDESFIPGLNNLVEAVHSFGSKIFAQLSIGFGRQGHALDGTPPYAPSAIPVSIPIENVPKQLIEYILSSPAMMHPYDIPREMTIEEIHGEEKEYAEACRRAVIAGFDGIEIHAPHGYLEHQFLSPRSNKRKDLYGGSLLNRMRFVAEVIDYALEAVNDAVPVGIRLSAAEHMQDGFTADEMIEVVKKVEELGVAFLHLSDGSYEAMKYFFPENMEHVQEHLLKEAKAIKAALKIPVITPSIHDPEVAERSIKDGTTDMISLGRQAIADPDWPNKVKDGKAGSIKYCKRDNICLNRCNAGLYPRCSVNPEAGFEEHYPELFQTRREGPLIPKSISKLYGRIPYTANPYLKFPPEMDIRRT